MSAGRTPRLRLGSRRSALAMAQSTGIAAALARHGVEVEIVEIVTQGDLDRTSALAALGGSGVFVSALRQALRQGRVDLAVHSLKDLPTAPEPDLVVAAVPRREDPRDVVVARDGLTLAQLPTGSIVGTGSPRRAAQLAALGLGLLTRQIRGNVGTRIDQVHQGRYDATLLARAGLARLGRLDEVTETLDPMLMLPAPGQGAVAVECRAGDCELVARLARLDDPDTRACVTAERSLLSSLEAGCSAPLGALAEVVEGEDGPELSLRGVVAAADGTDLRRSVLGSPHDPAGLGRRLAALMLSDGAADLMSTPIEERVP